MREILFRGKRKDNGEWVEGIPMRTNSTEIGIGKKITFMNVVPWTDKRKGKILAYFDPKNCPAIDDNTICQYTGLCDENGTKIFEGDIVKHIQKYEISGEVKSIAVIKWNEAYSCWSVEYTNGRITAFLGTEYHKIEVIGNAHDNPELLNK